MTRSTKQSIIILVAAVALIYGNSLRNEFTQDDFFYIVTNPQLHGNPLRLFAEPHQGSNNYRPVTFASYALNKAVAGLTPWSFHLINLLLHALATVLLFLLLRKVLNDPRLALVAAWIFAVHPIHTEAVDAAVGRAELLAACFLLGAWILHLHDREWPALGLYLLAMMSKESAIVLPAMIVAGDYALGHFPPLRRYLRLGALGALYAGWLWFMQGGRFGHPRIPLLDNPLAKLSIGWRIVNALRVAWIYVGLQIFPERLSPDYSFNAIPMSFSSAMAALVVAATVAVFAAWCWALYRRNAMAVVAGAIYFFGFATTANVLIPTGTILGERLAYLPSAGFCLLAASAWMWILTHGEKRLRPFAVGLLAVIIACLAMRTVLRNRDWHDNFTLYLHATEVVPGSAKMHNNLGAQFMERGDTGPALTEYQLALAIYPEYGDLLASYGLLEYRLGHKQQGAGMMEHAYQISGRDNPNYDVIATTYAAALVDAGHPEAALPILSEVIAGAPRGSLALSRALSNRAVIYYKQSAPDAARADANAALGIDGNNKQAQNVLRLLVPAAR